MRKALLSRTALVGAALLASLGAGLALGLHMSPDAGEALWVMALVSGLGMAAVLIAVWQRLDSHVARPADRLAGEMRARAHADVSTPLDAAQSHALGDLGPAAAALCDALSEARAEGHARAAKATGAIEAERRDLADLLSEIPVGVLAVDGSDRITLYDRQSVHALTGVASLALGRSVHDYLAEEPLRDALSRLDGSGRNFVDAELRTADERADIRARVRRFGRSGGYILTMEVDEDAVPERPLAFDFGRVIRAPGPDLADTPLDELAYVVFDTETTGLDTGRDRLVQIGAVRGMGGRCIDGERFETLVDPERPIPSQASRIHGITDERVSGAPTATEALSRFDHFARDAVLVAHNAPFDLAFLRRQGREAGLSFEHPVLDTVLLSAAVYGEGESHTLDAIAERLDVTIPEAARHTAMGDAEATAKAFFRLLDILSGRGVRTFGDAIATMRRHESLLRDANRDRADVGE